DDGRTIFSTRNSRKDAGARGAGDDDLVRCPARGARPAEGRQVDGAVSGLAEGRPPVRGLLQFRRADFVQGGQREHQPAWVVLDLDAEVRPPRWIVRSYQSSAESM